MNTWIQRIIVWPLCLFLFTGFIFPANSNVLCIGDDGHIEFETFCHPSCDEAEVTRDVDTPCGPPNGRSDDSNCSHVELTTALWLGRAQNVSSYHLTSWPSVFTIDGHSDLIYADSSNSRAAESHLAHGQGPPSLSIATTILRC